MVQFTHHPLRASTLLQVVALLLLVAVMSAQYAWAQTAPRTTVGQATAAAPTSARPAVASGPDYRIGTGDVVRVVVFQNPDLTVEGQVTASGAIAFPLLGSVRIGGLTSSEAEQRIAEALRTGNFVKQPQVSVLVTQVRSNLVSVLGQVGRPGRYPIETAEVRLSEMLATAGGVVPTGADVVIVTGTRNGQPYRAEIDMTRLFGQERRSDDIVLQNGDVVWVDRGPLVYIYGEVQRPGAIRLERGMTVLQALASGGGLTQRGTEKGMRLHRRGGDGKVNISQPGMDDTLRDGDVIYVRESLF